MLSQRTLQPSSSMILDRERIDKIRASLPKREPVDYPVLRPSTIRHVVVGGNCAYTYLPLHVTA